MKSINGKNAAIKMGIARRNNAAITTAKNPIHEFRRGDLRSQMYMQYASATNGGTANHGPQSVTSWLKAGNGRPRLTLAPAIMREIIVTPHRNQHARLKKARINP